MIDRRLVQHFDWVLLSFTLLLVGIGLLALYSAVNAGPDVAHVTGPLYLKQAYWFGIGAAVMVVMFLFNYKWLNRWAFATYALSLALLVAGMSNMNPEITNLVPVLKSPWLTIHVAVIMAGYGFLGLASIMGLMNVVFFASLTSSNKSRL